MKIYIAYEGYLNRHDQQTWNIIGVYENESDAISAVQQTISASAVEVTDNIVKGIPTKRWTEMDWRSVNVGKVEERGVVRRS